MLDVVNCRVSFPPEPVPCARCGERVVVGELLAGRHASGVLALFEPTTSGSHLPLPSGVRLAPLFAPTTLGCFRLHPGDCWRRGS